LLSFFTYAKAGDNKTVTLIVSGQGKTQDQAKQSALRNAIEQAFGAFISSHTEIVNDNLIKDEIISVSNGNIQKYEIISEAELPDNLGYTSTLKATVSISKLTSFCESKGMQIEIKGSLFAFNIIQKQLSASNEAKTLDELVSIAINIAPKMFDYSIVSFEPYKIKNPYNSYERRYFEFEENKKQYCLPIKINVSINKNWDEYCKLLEKTLLGLAMSKSELEDCKKLNISYYPFDILINKKNYAGKYTFYNNVILEDNSQDKLSQDVYDGIVWEELNEANTRDYDNFYKSNRYAILANGFEKGNYDLNQAYFRTNIKDILNRINRFINSEAFNYIIHNQTSNKINAKNWKVLFSPISLINLNEMGYNKLVDKFISYDNKDFRKRRDMYAPVSYVNILNENSIIIQHIKPDTIIGFAYCSPLFNLDEIKELNKLEVKHK
jgi:hypothetical protein